jgi:hypothetical protein
MFMTILWLIAVCMFDKRNGKSLCAAVAKVEIRCRLA